MQPWEIFARSRYRQVFTPASGRRGMRTRIDGDRATVTVSTASGRRSAEVPLVREHGGWRLIIELPPAREREGAGEPTSAE